MADAAGENGQALRATTLHKMDAEIAKLMAETSKINGENRLYHSWSAQA
ncbi:hypothetical protein BH23PSE1_BH23PSE1_07690 [soil metagenome]